MLYGVTGKTGCGKNWFVESLFKINPNMHHIDMDKIGHKALEDPRVQKKLQEYFGTSILFTDLSKGRSYVNRRLLAERAFGNREDYYKLTEATWWRMEEIIDDILIDVDDDCFVINGAMLPMMKYFDMCDLTYLVKRNDGLRARDTMKRDKITMAEFIARDNNGLDYKDEQYDFVVINNGMGKLI